MGCAILKPSELSVRYVTVVVNFAAWSKRISTQVFYKTESVCSDVLSLPQFN